ncbi:hypothetical protein ABTZ03_42340 [Kitasatospora sp. NPDC096077]|uniref:hypothetical protein n=1 Tax=Kitasatospora sp. NPDC096077 TaxID=3155544 RepID=UPI003322140F
MTILIPLPGNRTNHDEGGGAVSVLAAERAAFAAARAARAEEDLIAEAEADRAQAEQQARLAAAMGIAAASASRASVWVSELAARTGSRHLAGYAEAVLACGRDLNAEDDEDGGLAAEDVFVLSGLVLVDEPGLTADECLALAAVGAIALAMPRTITAGCPDRQLPELAHHLDQAVDAGRRATA